jgi:hypothetical protein
MRGRVNRDTLHIQINGRDTPTEQAATLAHELFHTALVLAGRGREVTGEEDYAERVAQLARALFDGTKVDLPPNVSHRDWAEKDDAYSARIEAYGGSALYTSVKDYRDRIFAGSLMARALGAASALMWVMGFTAGKLVGCGAVWLPPDQAAPLIAWWETLRMEGSQTDELRTEIAGILARNFGFAPRR